MNRKGKICCQKLCHVDCATVFAVVFVDLQCFVMLQQEFKACLYNERIISHSYR